MKLRICMGLFVAGMCVVTGCGQSAISGRSTASAPAKAAEPVFHYFPAETMLRGTLHKEPRLGPPGFGESPKRDARVQIFLLKLDQPISVQAAADADASRTANLDSYAHQREIQLFFKSKEGSAAPALLGRMVTVTGALSEAVAPGQYTSVTMDVSTLSAK